MERRPEMEHPDGLILNQDLRHSIHVWRAKVNDFTLCLTVPYLSRALSQTELDRFNGFRVERAAHEFAVGRLMLRSVLSRYFPKIYPSAWQFDFNQYGKPTVRGLNEIDFNLSHSGGQVVLAVTKDAFIGIDIESPRADIDHQTLAVDAFSKNEIAYLKANPDPANFYRFWTLKEAYIKACGMGLARQLNNFSFDLQQKDMNIRIQFGSRIADNPNQWWFASTELDSLPIALAVKSDGRGRHLVFFDFKTG